MPNANQNLEFEKGMPKALPSTALTILLVCLPLLNIAGLKQSAYAAGPVQPASCEHPKPLPPPIPYPSNLNQVPVNSASFPPPGDENAPITPGGPIQSPCCEHPIPLPPFVPYPGNLSQVPVNSASFPPQPVTPYCPTNYGVIPFHHLPAHPVAGAGNYPGIGIPGNVFYGAGTSTLRTPLVLGASWVPAEFPAPIGNLPPIGSGFTPNPVNPGMLGETPSLIPWTDGSGGNPQTHVTGEAVIPANQIDQQTNTVSMPITNMSAQPPGTWNSQGMRDSIPKAPSTPGVDRGILKQPSFNGGSQTVSNSSPYAAAVSLPYSGQFPTGVAPTERTIQRGKSQDFGLSQKTPSKKEFFAYRMQMSRGEDGEPISNGWQGQAGSTTQDFGVGVKQLAAAGKLGSLKPPQISYDSARPAQYPGQPNGTLGNHRHSADPPFFAAAQVTNDLYGTPMINPNRNYSDGTGSPVSSIPLTTIAPF